jgi:hypothetical protein
VTPRFELSDHPPFSTCFAKDWVTNVMNAVMRSDMWMNTAIFLDDSGSRRGGYGAAFVKGA